MKNLFIPYKLAVIAKEKGFNEKCFGFWAGNPNVENYNWHLNITENNWHNHKNNTTAIVSPLYQQILDWLEQRGVFIESVNFNQTICYTLLKKNDNRWIETELIHLKDINKAIEEAFKLIPNP